MNPVSGKEFAYYGLKSTKNVFQTPREQERENNRKISVEMNFNKYFDGILRLYDDDLILAYANVHVARAIPASGYNKTSENVSNQNVNLQEKLPRKWDTFQTFANSE